MVSRSLKAVAGLKLHGTYFFYASFGVLGRALKLVALTTGCRNKGFGEIKVKTHLRTVLITNRMRMNCLLGVFVVVQLANIESIRQTVNKVIKDDMLSEVDLYHFFVRGLKVFHRKRPDSENIVHVLVLRSTLWSYHILNYQIEREASWVLLSGEE